MDIYEEDAACYAQRSFILQLEHMMKGTVFSPLAVQNRTAFARPEYWDVLEEVLQTMLRTRNGAGALLVAAYLPAGYIRPLTALQAGIRTELYGAFFPADEQATCLRVLAYMLRHIHPMYATRRVLDICRKRVPSVAVG